ncbi:MAG: hypothetical protein RIE08_17590 [Acidimicrobiales bacterium]
MHLPIEEAADACGEMVWICDALFTTWGRWSTDEPDPAARVHWAVASRRHGTWAPAWRDLLPTSPQLDAPTRIRGAEPWQAVFGDLDGADLDTATRLAVAADVVLPALHAGLEALLAGSGEIADAPMRRVIRAHFADVEDETSSAAALVAPLAAGVDGDRVAAVAAHIADMGPSGGDA